MRQGLPKRLESVLKCAIASAREIDRLSGLTVGHTQLIATGIKPNPETATIAALAITLGFSLDWLVLGKGDAPSADHVRSSVERAQLNPLMVKALIVRALGPLPRSRRKPRVKPLSRPRPLPSRPEART